MMLLLISGRGMQTCSGLVDRYIVERNGWYNINEKMIESKMVTTHI